MERPPLVELRPLSWTFYHVWVRPSHFGGRTSTDGLVVGCGESGLHRWVVGAGRLSGEKEWSMLCDDPTGSPSPASW